jgi:hypothetical protein
MKKLLYVFAALLFFACSSSDDSSSASSSDFNPPAWIQGTWVQEGTTQGQGVAFRFSAHDFCMSSSIVEQCYQGVIDLSRKGGANSNVEETTTSSSYSAKINYGGGQSVTYSFKKISSSEIECTSLFGTVFIKK